MITTMSTVYLFKTSSYAINIYMYGTNRLTARDGYVGLSSMDYYIPVQQYFANRFTMDNLNNALAQGWINQQEYNETLIYMPTV